MSRYELTDEAHAQSASAHASPPAIPPWRDEPVLPDDLEREHGLAAIARIRSEILHLGAVGSPKGKTRGD